MINNGQSTLLLYCCEDVKSHRSAGGTVPLSVGVFLMRWNKSWFMIEQKKHEKASTRNCVEAW